jgi:hypothetical protein
MVPFRVPEEGAPRREVEEIGLSLGAIAWKR